MPDEVAIDVETLADAAWDILAGLAAESGDEVQKPGTVAGVIESLEQMCRKLDQRYRNLGRENHEALEMAVDLEEKNQRLARVNAKLAELYAELEATTFAVQGANVKLAEANAQAAELMGHLEIKDLENNRLNTALSRANAAAAELMADLEERNEQLRQSMAEIKTLRGFVPICAHCKQVRDDKGFWEQVEAYLSRNSELAFSHSICPACCEKYYAEYLTDKDREEMGLLNKPAPATSES